MPHYNISPDEVSKRFQKDRLMDIIGYPPSWILRSGVSMISIFTLLFLGLSWLIRYPDIIEAPVIISSSQPPIPVFSQYPGVIDSLYVKDGDYVTFNQRLLLLQNTADLEHVIIWGNWLRNIEKSMRQDSLISFPSNFLQLGELNLDYTLIRQKYYEWQRILNDPNYNDKIRAYNNEINSISKLNQSIEKQLEIYEREIKLLEKNLEREKIMLKQGVVSASEFEKTESSFLATNRQKESIATGKLLNQAQINQLRAQIVDHLNNYSMTLSKIVDELKQMSSEAISEIARWEEHYMVKSNADGYVSMSGNIRNKAFILSGEPLFSIIVPNEDGLVYARASVKSTGLGKIERGNRVIIRLDAWPYKQFGSLITTIDEIAKLPLPGKSDSNLFELTMIVDNPSQTSSGIELPMKPIEMGNARIITKERRFLDRIFEQFNYLTNN